MAGGGITDEGEDSPTRQDKEPDGRRYALLFRIHFWDAFAQRQFDRAVALARSADIFVLADETRGKIANIGATHVIGLTDDEIVAAGFPAAGEGNLQWFSADVPLYLFHRRFPGYDYYVQIEYDVAVNTDIDALVDRLRADRADVLALTNPEPIERWHWRSTCLAAYPPDELRHQLICFSAFSARALEVLSARRLEQAAAFKSGALAAWPIGEGFVPSEAARQGLKLVELSRYGDVAAYRWWPPILESELPRLRHHGFLHPVLGPDRYVASLLRPPQRLRWLLSPGSWLHRKLGRLGMSGYLRLLIGQPFRAAVRMALARKAREVFRSGE